MHISHLKIFLATRTNTFNPLERAGNILLTPARVIWNGYSIAFLKIKGSSLEQHLGVKAEYEHKLLSTPFGKLVCLAALIVTLIPGILLKGFAYVFPSVQESHWKVIDSFAIEKSPPIGITIKAHEEAECDPFDLKNQPFGACTITIDLATRIDAGEDRKDLYTFVYDKLASLKPHLSFFNAELHFEGLSELPNFPPAHPDSKFVHDTLSLHMLNPHSSELHMKRGGRYDYVSEFCHKDHPGRYMWRKEIDDIYNG